MQTILTALLMTFLWSSYSLGATVKSIITKKRLIKIDAGTDQGIEKGTIICFASPSGTKLGCGKVRITKAAHSYVRVSKKRIQKIQKGSIAYKKGESPEVSSGSSETATASFYDNFKLAWSPTIGTPAAFQKLAYKPPSSGATTLWDPKGKNNVSFMAFSAEYEMSLGGDLTLAPGLYYKAFRDFKAVSNYSNTDSTLYAETLQTGTMIGLYLDSYFFTANLIDGLMYWRLGAGLEYSIASTTFEITQKSDVSSATSTIATGKAGSSVMSLRIPTQFDLMMGSLGLFAGINFILPVVELGNSFSGTVSDPNASLLTGKSSTDDLKDSLAMGKGSFGIEITGGGMIAF